MTVSNSLFGLFGSLLFRGCLCGHGGDLLLLRVIEFCLTDFPTVRACKFHLVSSLQLHVVAFAVSLDIQGFFGEFVPAYGRINGCDMAQTLKQDF